MTWSENRRDTVTNFSCSIAKIDISDEEMKHWGMLKREDAYQNSMNNENNHDKL